MKISIIVAMSPNHAIGVDGHLPWNIPEDMAHFKRLTTGHTIIMGRKTYESLPHGALPNRRNIVLTRSPRHIDGCDVFHSLAEALSSCHADGEVFIIGGASVYADAMPIADKAYITLRNDNPRRADTFFPPFDKDLWRETKKEKHDGFSFIELEKITG